MEELHSLNDLYLKVLPAIICRCNELKKEGLNVKPESIWNELQNKWKNSIDLTINDIVKDILSYKGV